MQYAVHQDFACTDLFVVICKLWWTGFLLSRTTILIARFTSTLLCTKKCAHAVFCFQFLLVFLQLPNLSSPFLPPNSFPIVCASVKP